MYYELIIYYVIGFMMFALILALLVMAGREGRFFIKMFGKRGGIFLGLKSTKEAQFYHVEAEGRNLRCGKKMIVQTSDILVNPQDRDKGVEFNTLVQTGATLASKPFLTGSITAMIGASPKLNEAVSRAQQLKDKVKNDPSLINKDQQKAALAFYDQINVFLNLLKKWFEEGIKEVVLWDKWAIDTLIHYAGISFTEQDIEEAYQLGYNDGVSSVHSKEKWFIAGFIGICVLFVVFVIYKSWRG